MRTSASRRIYDDSTNGSSSGRRARPGPSRTPGNPGRGLDPRLAVRQPCAHGTCTYRGCWHDAGFDDPLTPAWRMRTSSQRDRRRAPISRTGGPMDQREDATSATSRLPSTEELIRERLEEERTRLEQELGIDSPEVQHFERPAERPFTRDQRPHTTVLFGGLTWKHERLIEGGLAGLGYQCEAMPVPDVAAFQLGKEYGNNGQCNPTYFTVGNLVKYLQELEREGRSRQEILDRYIFVTAGACGPCRFGMYEAEYRLALRNSGFDGFRVILFQQAGGITQSGAEAGLEMDLDFFLAILNAMNMGDLLNDSGYQLRPFEVEAGAVDDALATGMELLYEVLRDKRTFSLESYVARLLADRKLGDITRKAGKFADQLVTSAYTDAF